MEETDAVCVKVRGDMVGIAADDPGVEQKSAVAVPHRKEVGSIYRVSSQPCMTGARGNRKHHSSPTPPSSVSCMSSEGFEHPVTRSRFEKRQKWSNSKQGSIDLPDDLPACPEDNVFADPQHDRCTRLIKGRTLYQRSFSVPATLPDVVQEANTCPGDRSPDVLLKVEAERKNICGTEAGTEKNGSKHDLDGNCETAAEHTTSAEFAVSEQKEHVSGIDSRHSSNTSEDQCTKLMFEGPVCDNPLSHRDGMRRKSVSFDTAVNIVTMMSARGRKARDHFRSSGYGSQSEGSHNSQKSDNTSHEESVMSDDVLLERSPSALSSMEQSSFETGFGGSVETERSSFETGFGGSTDQCTYNMEQEYSPTQIDGSVDGSDSGTQKEGSSISDSSENSKTFSGSSPSHLGAVGGTIDPESRMKTVHDTVDDTVPLLSIFDQMSVREMSGGSVVVPGLAGEDFSYQRLKILEGSENPDRLVEYNEPLPFEQTRPSDNTVGLYSVPREGAEPHSDRFSPTSVQRDLLERMFYDRMEKFDPQQENISELLNWMKNNMEEALTPSPKSPFFTAEGSPQSIALPPSIAAALGITTVEVGGKLSVPKACVSSNQLHPASACACASSSASFTVISEEPNSTTVSSSGEKKQSSTQSSGQRRTVVSATQYPQSTTYSERHQETVPSAAQSPQPSSQQSSRLQAAHFQQAVPTVVEEEPLSMSEASVGLHSGSSLDIGVSDSCLEQVLRLSQCTESSCHDTTCLQWKERMQKLKDAIRRGDNLSDDGHRVLKVLCGHYEECDQPNCLVPWCRFICRWYHNASGREIRPEAVLSALGNPVHTLLPGDFHVTGFFKLISELPFQAMPKEWEHWLLLCPLSQSQMVIRAVPLDDVCSNRHWAIKLTNVHEGRNQLEVLQSLRDLRHPYLVPHLWAAADERNDLLLVCTEYQPGLSLKELLSQRLRLDCCQSYKYLLQILSALECLHGLAVVYLNWDSSNFLLDQTCQKVQMTNFTSSVHLPGDNADIGNIKLSLPADIVPPEFLVDGGDLQYNSDTWGVACILYELLTGGRPWYHLRHLRQEDIWRQIKKQVRPDICRNIPNCMQALLQGCFKRSPGERLSVGHLTNRIQRELQTFSLMT